MNMFISRLCLDLVKHLDNQITIREVSLDYIKGIGDIFTDSEQLTHVRKMEMETVLGKKFGIRERIRKIQKGDRVILYQNMHRIPEHAPVNFWAVQERKWLLLEA